MNTPAHLAVNLLVLSRRATPRTQLVVMAGALLPDAPMLWFYFQQRVLMQVPESTIWSETYFEPGWQNIFDLFNSMPLMLIGVALGVWRGSKFAVLFFASMLLHALTDLLLHHDDAHRHFFPLSDWRFESPVSYWDPRFYGNWVMPLEALLVLICCSVVFLDAKRFASRLQVGLLGGVYLAYWGFAFTVWG